MTRPGQQPSVCALLTDSSRSLAAAVARQSRPPDATVRHPGPPTVGLRRALATGCDWVWVLDGHATPGDFALAALLSALERARDLRPPAVLAGVVRTDHHALDLSLTPWYRRTPTELAMRAVESGLLPIRAAPAPVLVARRAIAAAGSPRSRLEHSGAVLEWTARLLRDGTGYWVPESESVALGPSPRRMGFRATGALLAGGALTGVDRVRGASELRARATTPIRRRRGRRRQQAPDRESTGPVPASRGR